MMAVRPIGVFRFHSSAIKSLPGKKLHPKSHSTTEIHPGNRPETQRNSFQCKQKHPKLPTDLKNCSNHCRSHENRSRSKTPGKGTLYYLIYNQRLRNG